VGSTGGVASGVGVCVSAATWFDGRGGSGVGVHAAATMATANTPRIERPLTRLIARIVAAVAPNAT
jgi:hypothetical protein